MGIIKGQNLRLTLGTKFVAFATDCTVHVAANLEESSTKDSTGDFSEQEITGLSWDISTNALFAVNPSGSQTADLTGLYGDDALDLLLAKGKVDITFEQTTGSKNRGTVSGGMKYTGQVIINDVSINATNRQNASYSLSAQGVGPLTKA